jgi:hypothetical protein
VVATVVAACLAVAALMAKESGMGWQLGISGEEAMRGLDDYARKIRAAADQAMPSGIIQVRRSVTAEDVEQFTSRWNEDRNAFRVTQLYSAPTVVTSYPAHVYPVEAFAACPHCRAVHYPLIVGRHDSDDAMCLIRECMYCHNTWTQQEPL